MLNSNYKVLRNKPACIFGVMLISVMLVIFSALIYDRLDTVLLSEYANGFYKDMNTDGRFSDFYIPSDHEEYDTAYNYLCLDIDDRYVQGIDVHVNKDNSITLNGKNDGDAFDLMVGYIEAPCGEYTLSSAIDNRTEEPDGERFGYLYIWGETCNDMNENVDNRITVEDPLDTYTLFMHCNEGETADNITIHPMIIPASISKAAYMPGSIPAGLIPEDSDTGRNDGPDESVIEEGYRAIKRLRIERRSYETMPDSDKRYLVNYIGHVVADKGYDWFTIDLCDGTGIQFIDCDPRKQVTGRIDAWGRVQ